MDGKNKERGILKLEPRPRGADARAELTPQGSSERAPASPQPSVDRLSVTWADPGSMASSGVNLFHLPSESAVSNEVKFSPSAADGSEDEDYSASLSAVLRQRRASVRRSRKGRTRRPSSPFLQDEPRLRRRSSVFTTSSGDTAISMEEGQPLVTQEQIFENIHLHKEVLGSVKQQPLEMSKKLKIVHQAKGYIKRHQGQLQERLAQSKSTRDIYARFNILLASKLQQLKREAANTSNLLIPWEMRIKEIESHFGSVVASYFTFLRWLFWVNLVIGFILLVFVIVPECLTADPMQDGERKLVMEDERRNASNLLNLWEFEGILKYSPIFYGYYSNVERPQYRMPLAYFLTGLVVYIFSFVAILRKMAENSRMSKLSEKEDECIFSWKLFTGWDFMIGNAETAHNRIASVILGFKEALLEEAEKKKDLKNWRIISLRALVNICVLLLLALSAYAVVKVVSHSDNNSKSASWWRENETSFVVTVITISFPIAFELLGLLEHYHPRKQLRLQLARIMLLNLLNLYSLIFALIWKIDGMSKDLNALKPNITMNASIMTETPFNMSESPFNISDTVALNLTITCYEVNISCTPCNIPITISKEVISGATKSVRILELNTTTMTTPITIRTTESKPKTDRVSQTTTTNALYSTKKLPPENLVENNQITQIEATTTEESVFLDGMRQLELLKQLYPYEVDSDESSNETYPNEDVVDMLNYTEIGDMTITSGTATYYKESFPEESTVSNIDSATATESDTTNISDTETVTDYTDSTEVTDDNTEVMLTEYDFTTFITPSHITPTVSISSDNEITIITASDAIAAEESTTYDTTTGTDFTITASATDQDFSDSTTVSIEAVTICPDISFNCTVYCNGRNVTQVFSMLNCTILEKRCYTMLCKITNIPKNTTVIDIVYEDENKRKMYNLTKDTRTKLLKLCWETMFGQELIKLTMMDLVVFVLGTLFTDFFRALFVRYMNRCWCWDLEKKFPEYGDFKIAENILHLINNQGLVWMGMFFSPGLVVLNVFKLMIIMYMRSWAVMTCNVPHEVVFRVSKSNNFYLALLLTMLFLCVLPVGYTIVWVRPSWHCGPFSEYDKIYYIMTENIYKILPKSLNFALEYIASPAMVIPLLVLLILIIYYLTSLTNSLREANNDLKIQLRRERTEERRKMFQIADTRRRAGSSALDNTPFARWKRALPPLPLSKSIDSDDRKTITGDENAEPIKSSKKKGSIFAKIVGMAIDKKSDVEALSISENPVSPSSNNFDDETDTDFHETLPNEVLKIKDITFKQSESKNKIHDPDTDKKGETSEKTVEQNLKVKSEKLEDNSEKRPYMESEEDAAEISTTDIQKEKDKHMERKKKFVRNETSESSTQSRKSDSIGSVIPVITISTTESDDEVLQAKKGKTTREKEKKKTGDDVIDEQKRESAEKGLRRVKKSCTDFKSLRRQSSVDSTHEHKVTTKEKKPEDGHKYQYSL